jgi:hypothetical protein
MTSINLNPEDYTDNELQKLLSLPDNYTHQDIIQHKQKLIHQLNRDKKGSDINNSYGIDSFLGVITRRLTEHIANHIQSSNNAPSGTSPNPMKTLNSITQHGNNIMIANRNSLDGLEAKIPDGRTVGAAVPAGHMNPINVRTIEQSINIDSRFRKNYYSTLSTKFSLTLPEPQKNVVKMSVDSLALPLTHYAISAHNKNNTFLIINAPPPHNEEALEKSCADKEADVEPDAWLVSLPDGNYEQSWLSESMATSIETAMNIAISRAVPGKVDKDGKFNKNISGTLITPKSDIYYGVDRTSGKSFFQCPQGITITDPCVRFNVDLEGNLSMDENIQMRLGWVLGFRAARYVANKTLRNIVSEGICYPVGPIYGFLAVNDYQNNTGPVYLQAYSQSAMDNNIIAKINLSNEMAGNGVFKTSDGFTVQTSEHSVREYFGPVNIHKLDIAIYDEYGRIVNLNNMDLSLTLRFEKLYD